MERLRKNSINHENEKHEIEFITQALHEAIKPYDPNTSLLSDHLILALRETAGETIADLMTAPSYLSQETTSETAFLRQLEQPRSAVSVDFQERSPLEIECADLIAEIQLRHKNCKLWT